MNKKNDRGSLLAAIVVFIIVFIALRSIGCSNGCAGCVAGGCSSQYGNYNSCTGCVAGSCIGAATGCRGSGGRPDTASGTSAPTSAASNITVDISPKSEVYINDYTSTLTDDEKSAIAAAGQKLYGDCGVQLVAVVINDASKLGNDELSDYAYRIFNAWGVGDSATNRGLLLLINIAEGEYPGNAYCIEGTGLESLLPASELGSIIDSYVLPRLDERQFSAAVQDGYGALALRLNELYGD